MSRLGPPLRPTDRVLVRLPSWLGDLVAAEPAVRALAAAVEEGGALSLAGPAHLLPLLDGAFPRARRIPHSGRGGERAGDWRGHDVAVLLTGSFRSAWTAWRAGIPRRVGSARDGRGWLLTDRARPALERGRTPFGLGVAGGGRRFLPRPVGAGAIELAGLVGVAVADPAPRIPLSEEGRGRVRARLRERGLAAGASYVLANVGARAGSAKGLPAALWTRVLADLARGAGLPLVLVRGPGDEDVEAELAAAVPGAGAVAFGPPAADLAELAALSAGAALVVTADTGPRHVAAALGTPLVCVLGPTDPRHVADGPGGTRLVRVEVDCGPCHRERCPLPGERHHACMTRVDPAEVVGAALALLG